MDTRRNSSGGMNWPADNGGHTKITGISKRNGAASHKNWNAKLSGLRGTAVQACLRPTPRASDAHYSNVGIQEACPPDQFRSRRASDRDTLVVLCQSVALRRDAITARTVQF